MKAALVINEQIVNIAVFPDGAQLPAGYVPFQSGMEIGGGFDGTTITPPPEGGTPASIEQAVILAQKAAAIAALPDSIKFLNAAERGVAASLFPEWRVGLALEVGDVIRWDGTLYEVLQAHTVDNPTFTPPTVPALYRAL
jgi:hypothetical protein